MVLQEWKQGVKVKIEVEGKIDARAAADLDRVLRKTIQGTTEEMTLDFSKVTFIASMGLRAILVAQKLLNEKKGKFNIINISEEVRNIFALTGIVDLFVQDEKLVIINKTRTIADLSLAGELDDKTLPILASNIKELEDKGIIDLRLNCGDLNVLSAGALKYIWETRKHLLSKKGSLEIQKIPESLKAAIRNYGGEEIL
jgi:anti-sigma B factor antagonist